jgi:hypothetical protein
MRTASLRELSQVAATFVLVCVGWLMFRETELPALVRDLTLSPFDSTLADRQIGGYLFLLTLTFSWPLWVHSAWAVYVTPRVRHQPSTNEWGDWWTVGQTILAGLALAAILVFRSQQSLDFIYFQF